MLSFATRLVRRVRAPLHLTKYPASLSRPSSFSSQPTPALRTSQLSPTTASSSRLSDASDVFDPGAQSPTWQPIAKATFDIEETGSPDSEIESSPTLDATSAESPQVTVVKSLAERLAEHRNSKGKPGTEEAAKAVTARQASVDAIRPTTEFTNSKLIWGRGETGQIVKGQAGRRSEAFVAPPKSTPLGKSVDRTLEEMLNSLHKPPEVHLEPSEYLAGPESPYPEATRHCLTVEGLVLLDEIVANAQILKTRQILRQISRGRPGTRKSDPIAAPLVASEVQRQEHSFNSNSQLAFRPLSGSLVSTPLPSTPVQPSPESTRTALMAEGLARHDNPLITPSNCPPTPSSTSQLPLTRECPPHLSSESATLELTGLTRELATSQSTPSPAKLVHPSPTMTHEPLTSEKPTFSSLQVADQIASIKKTLANLEENLLIRLELRQHGPPAPHRATEQAVASQPSENASTAILPRASPETLDSLNISPPASTTPPWYPECTRTALTPEGLASLDDHIKVIQGKIMEINAANLQTNDIYYPSWAELGAARRELFISRQVKGSFVDMLPSESWEKFTSAKLASQEFGVLSWQKRLDQIASGFIPRKFHKFLLAELEPTSIPLTLPFTPLTRQRPPREEPRDRSRGFEWYQYEVDTATLSSKTRPLAPLSPSPPIATLAHGLDRVLFNPGVHFLRDPRTGVYNFPPDTLENVPKIGQFDFAKLPEYITSSRDTQLMELAENAGKKFVGSTSSMVGMLCQIYFWLSSFKPVNLSMLSAEWQNQRSEFTFGQQVPVSVILHYKDGRYSIDADKSIDLTGDQNILREYGHLMEKLLTTEPAEFARFLKDSPNPARSEAEDRQAYHYMETEHMVLRSQLDAQNEHLPNVTFDVKTRASIAVRQDRQNWEAAAGYEVSQLQGTWNSFEREYYDLIRSAFLKYQFQARIGCMDGVIVAYHSTSKFFGFQYCPLPEMDRALFGTADVGNDVFLTCVGLLEKILLEASTAEPNHSLALTFAAIPESGVLRVFVAKHLPDADPETKPLPVMYEYRSQSFYKSTENKMVPFDFGTSPPAEESLSTSFTTRYSFEKHIGDNDREKTDLILRRLFHIRQLQTTFNTILLPAGVTEKAIVKDAMRKLKEGEERSPGHLSVRFPLKQGLTYTSKPSRVITELRRMSKEGAEKKKMEGLLLVEKKK
ncbi:hypothetical protein P7C70_g2349, partial [Phenoliferia sp. Uapishka_3]